MDKFEEHKMKKIRPVIRNWFDRFIKQRVMRKKSKVIRDKLKDKIINDIQRPFDTKKKERKKKKQNEKEERRKKKQNEKEERKKKKQNEKNK